MAHLRKLPTRKTRFEGQSFGEQLKSARAGEGWELYKRVGYATWGNTRAGRGLGWGVIDASWCWIIVSDHIISTRTIIMCFLVKTVQQWFGVKQYHPYT